MWLANLGGGFDSGRFDSGGLLGLVVVGIGGVGGVLLDCQLCLEMILYLSQGSRNGQRYTGTAIYFRIFFG